MKYLFKIFEFICELLISTKGYWKYHVQKLELSLNKLKEIGLKWNIEESFLKINKYII